MKGNLEIVKLLTESGALLNRKTKDGRTALYLAVQEGNIFIHTIYIYIYIFIYNIILLC